MRKTDGKRIIVDVGVGGMIILKWILKNRLWECGVDSSGSGLGPVAGSFKHGY